MTSPIVNLADLELQPRPPQFAPTGAAAEIYEARAAFVSRQLGASKLGYNVTAIAPGKRAFPFHNHHCNDEMFFILSGAGEIRIGDACYPVRAGDIVSCAAGGPETAHQIVNSGAEELRFLAVSSMHSPDVVEYPESGRFGLLANLAPTTEGQERVMMYVGREEDGLGYWES